MLYWRVERLAKTSDVTPGQGEPAGFSAFRQVTPHDVRDYDFELPPILTTVGSGSRTRSIVVGAGKAGLVIAWDESLRTRIWQTAVGRHLNDLGPLPRHTVEICPGFYGGVESAMALADGTVFVPVVDLCAHGSATGYQAIGTLSAVDGTGEFVALDARSGVVLCKRLLAQPVFGRVTAPRADAGHGSGGGPGGAHRALGRADQQFPSGA